MKRGTTARSYTVRSARVTYALPASTTATESNPKNPSKTNRSKGIVDPVRPATCLDRSVTASGAICADATPGHARGQAPVAGAPGAALGSCRRRCAWRWSRGPGPAAHRAGASHRRGLSPSGDCWRVWANRSKAGGRSAMARMRKHRSFVDGGANGSNRPLSAPSRLAL
jgi:hypothetical protein